MNKPSVPLALLFLQLFTQISAQDFFGVDLKQGRYGVGFRSVQTQDYTRTVIEPDRIDRQGSQKGRRMTLNIWYPATTVSSRPMNYEEYISPLVGKPENRAAARADFFRMAAELSADTLLFSSVYPALADSKTNAYRNATIASGSFPLIIYPDNVHVQSILCEYLASNGFVIVSPVIRGTYSEPMEYNLQGIETGIADMQFALGYMRSHYNIKQDFSLIGIGFNATLALGMQMRNSDAKAMVSLEGGITTGFEEALIKRTPYFDLQRITRSILIIHAPHPDVKPEITYKYKYAEKIYQYYPQSSEFYFLNYGVWEQHLKNIFPKVNKGNTWKSFAYAAESIFHYLSWKLNSDNSGEKILLESSWPNNIVQTSIKQANQLPPSTGELKKMLSSQGIQGLENLYNERKKSDPQPFSFSSFYQVGQQLIEKASYQHLLNWATLYADSYPYSALPYSMLGRAQLELNNKDEAKRNYEKALALLVSDVELSEGEKSYFKTAIENRLKGLKGEA